MNEVILRLAKKAGFDSELMEHNHNKGNPSIAEKFAELIVRECADVGSKFSQAHPEDISYQIKRHFGVDK